MLFSITVGHAELVEACLVYYDSHFDRLNVTGVDRLNVTTLITKTIQGLVMINPGF